MMRHEQRSLFGEILDWMLTPLLLLWPISLAFTWFVAQDLADKPFDRTLEYNAYALAELLSVQDGQVRLNLERPASGVLRADEADVVYFQVLAPSGALLAGEGGLPIPPQGDGPARDHVLAVPCPTMPRGGRCGGGGGICRSRRRTTFPPATRCG